MRLFWLGIAWLAGIAIGELTGLPAWFFLLGIGLAIATIANAHPVDSSSLARHGLLSRLRSALRRIDQRQVGALVLLVSLGAFRLALSAPKLDASHIASYNDLFRPITVIGVIDDYPDVRDRYVGLRLEVEQVELSGSGETIPVEGLILVQADRYRDYHYGDRVAASGILETPPEDEDFSYRDYLAHRGIFSLMENAQVSWLAAGQANPLLQVIFALRLRAFETVHDLFPDPEASLMAGILLGLESGISPQVREAFNRTGTTHIIAISGFNLTVLSALVIRLFGRWLGVRRGTVAAAATIALYTLLVGADAAVVRAAIMSGLALFGRFLGRRAHGLASLSAAAVLMTAIQPSVLWDVGFQLSFAATLGLVLYADPIQDRFIELASRWLPRTRAERLAVPVGEYMLFTLAAQATTLPLTAAYFQRLSLSSLLANPVILPAQPPLMILGGVATIAGMILPPAGKLIALLAWPFPAFTIRAVSLFADLPSSAVGLGNVSLLTVALIYVLLFGATWLLGLPAEKRPQLPRPSPAMLVLGLAIVTGVTWREVATRPDGRTHLTCFDSGSCLIETAAGRYLLIGGGDSPIQLSQQLGRRLPLLHRQIDWLIVTDTREQQVRGLVDLTDRYRILSAWVPGQSGGTAYQSVLAELQASDTTVVQPEVGWALELDDGSQLAVFDRDPTRLSLQLTAGRASLALLAGSDPLNEDSPARLTAATALIVHDPSPSEWLEAMHPWLAVATGRPRDPDAWPLRTELAGWIELVTDGQYLWVQSQQPVHLPAP